MEYFTAIWLDLNGGSPLSALSALHKVSLIACAVSLLIVVWELSNAVRSGRSSYAGRQKMRRKSY